MISEESFNQIPAVWPEWAWIVDPLDGTTNFTVGNPVFSIAIGLAHHATPILGVIALPMLNEVLWAVRGRGCLRNGMPVRIREPDLWPRDAVVTTGMGYKRERDFEQTIALFRDLFTRCRACRVSGSACWV